ncbi:MAG: Gldg family protein, partial [Planctomycetota bacterium]
MGRERPARWQLIAAVAIPLGLVMLVAGFVVRDIRARALVQVDHVALGLWVAGAVLALGGAVVNGRAIARAVGGGRAADRINFGVAVLLALGLAGLLCYITTRRFARMDWTGKATHALHSKTRNILSSLQTDVEAVVVFARAEDPLIERSLTMTLDMLEEFEALSDHVTVQRINWTLPADQPRWEELRQRLEGEEPPGFAVVFLTAQSHEVVPLAKVITRSIDQIEFRGEDAFASTLTKLLQQEKATIYFLTGHGEWPHEPKKRRPPEGPGGPEYSLSRFAKALRKDNYEVKALNLAAEGSVPADCAALIIPGPKTPLAGPEIQALGAYLQERSGSAIVLLDPEFVAGAQTNLGQILEPYGIRVRTDAVGITNIDMGIGILQSQEVTVPGDGFADHPITSDLANYNVSLQYACPIELDGAPTAQGAQGRALLQGLKWAWGEVDYEPDSQEAAEYEPGRDMAPPLVVGAVVEPAWPRGMPLPPGREAAAGPKLVVIGSSMSFVNQVLDVQPANLYLLQNSVNWMAGKLHMLGIPPKDIELTQVPVSESQLAASRYIFIGALPALIIALGFG